MRTQSSWQISHTPIQQQTLWAENGGYIFASSDWAEVLSTLTPEIIYAWNAELQFGLLIPVFRKLSLRIGIFGLPTAGKMLDSFPETILNQTVREISSACNLHIIRMTHSALTFDERTATSARPEVWIDQLSNWPEAKSNKLRKHLNLASQLEDQLEIVEGDSELNVCFDLYEETIRRHLGHIRYNRLYFNFLSKISTHSKRLKIFRAIDASGDTHAFAIGALHGEVGYYLHGGVREHARTKRTFYLLLEKLIHQAIAVNCSEFSLMSSPWSQDGLIRFKKQWGTRECLAVTQDSPHGVIASCAKSLIRYQARRDRLNAIAWCNAKLKCKNAT
jgi:hypothetical protein